MHVCQVENVAGALDAFHQVLQRRTDAMEEHIPALRQKVRTTWLIHIPLSAYPTAAVLGHDSRPVMDGWHVLCLNT